MVILGREAVERALAERGVVDAYFDAHPAAVRDAVATIRRHLPGDTFGAVAFAQGLDVELRMAIAGAWLDGAGKRAIARLGLERAP